MMFWPTYSRSALIACGLSDLNNDRRLYYSDRFNFISYIQITPIQEHNNLVIGYMI